MGKTGGREAGSRTRGRTTLESRLTGFANGEAAHVFARKTAHNTKITVSVAASCRPLRVTARSTKGQRPCERHGGGAMSFLKSNFYPPHEHVFRRSTARPREGTRAYLLGHVPWIC